VRCSGEELKLELCPKSAWASSDAPACDGDHSHDASVSCGIVGIGRFIIIIC